MSKDEEPISRVTRSKAEAKANYDRLSRWYDLLAWSERKAVTAGLGLLAAAPGETILEIGYGTGRSLISLARAVGPSGHIYGIDISEGMHRVASQRLCKAGFTGRATLTCGDAIHLPYEDEAFVGVFMAFTLELFDTPEIPAVLRECRRVLRPKGRIVVVAMERKTPPRLAQRLYEWAHRRLPRLVDCRPIDAVQPLTAVGFTVASVRELTVVGLPVQVAVGTLGPSLWAALEDNP